MFPSIHHLCQKQSHEKKRWSSLDYWNCKLLDQDYTLNLTRQEEAPHCCAIQSLKEHFQRGPKVSQSQQVSA
ncbi:unnamed protein product [Sphagnum jensenii]|uniref:Uncharacterized protein n=1 Tax=Sphagnum jensenii TaxID=128206 RepID=A0ABP0XI24_9BRYO